MQRQQSSQRTQAHAQQYQSQGQTGGDCTEVHGAEDEGQHGAEDEANNVEYE